MTVFIYLSLFCSLLAVVPAILLERRRKVRSPNQRPYTWGYFQGIAGLLFSLVLIVGGLSKGLDADAVAGLLYFVVLAIAAWLTIQRNRWAYIVFTLGSLNPFLWVINGVYISHRWKELSGLPTAPEFGSVQ